MKLPSFSIQVHRMQDLLCSSPAGRVFPASILLLLLLLSFQGSVQSQGNRNNITAMLSKYPEFKKFRNSLVAANLTYDIDIRNSITVCALSNIQMAYLPKNNMKALKDSLSLHVLLDFFTLKKLRQLPRGITNSTTLLQTSGDTEGTMGAVKINHFNNGSIAIAVMNNTNWSLVVKEIQSISSNISIIQIAHPLISSQAVEAPSRSPTFMNLTALMNGSLCNIFAKTLAADVNALHAFSANFSHGLSVFCPGDTAFKKFLPMFTKLTKRNQALLLKYHAWPKYKTMGMLTILKDGEKENTLASDGSKDFKLTLKVKNGTVKISTGIVTAKILKTIVDKKKLVIYEIDKVLKPVELFKYFNMTSSVPAPAPGPIEVADAPRKAKKKKSPPTAVPSSLEAPSPSPSDDDVPADQIPDDNGGPVKVNGKALYVSFFVGLFFLSM